LLCHTSSYRYLLYLLYSGRWH